MPLVEKKVGFPLAEKTPNGVRLRLIWGVMNKWVQKGRNKIPYTMNANLYLPGYRVSQSHQLAIAFDTRIVDGFLLWRYSEVV